MSILHQSLPITVKPSCHCLSTLGCGILLVSSIAAPSSVTSVATLSTSPALPLVTLSTPVAALLLVGWFVVMGAWDDCGVVQAVTTWWRKRRAQLQASELLKLQKQAVLEELLDTGLLSHMLRNTHTRILPLVLQRGGKF
jgi:hypothetical protein